MAVGMVASQGCHKETPSASTSPARSAEPPTGAAPSSSVALLAGGLPIPSASVLAVVNPQGLPAYSGPAGAVEGTVRLKGAPAPEEPGRKPPMGCGKALGMYGKLFRVAPDGALADTIVGVTEYNGYVPAQQDAVEVTIDGCAYDRRTVTMTYGQRLEVRNLEERESYLPHLDGSRNPALMVAIPRGDAVRMYPPRPGHYMLIDDLKHPWMQAEVFVFKYATHDVSKVDGRYRIENVPAGKVKVSVRHPAIETTIDKQVEIKPGETLKVDFEIPYEAPKPAPAPSGPAKGPIIK